ncbi:MAG: hypothetical protein ACN6I7_04060 [bacterium]
MRPWIDRLRGRRYIRHQVDIEGDPLPASGPLLFVDLHHGCGFWFLAHRLAQKPPTIRASRRDRGREDPNRSRLGFSLLVEAAGVEPVAFVIESIPYALECCLSANMGSTKQSPLWVFFYKQIIARQIVFEIAIYVATGLDTL